MQTGEGLPPRRPRLGLRHPAAVSPPRDPVALKSSEGSADYRDGVVTRVALVDCGLNSMPDLR
jgi:hypothetical protein